MQDTLRDIFRQKVIPIFINSSFYHTTNKFPIWTYNPTFHCIMKKNTEVNTTKIKFLCKFCAEDYNCFCGKNPCEHVYVLRESLTRLCPRWKNSQKDHAQPAYDAVKRCCPCEFK